MLTQPEPRVHTRSVRRFSKAEAVGGAFYQWLYDYLWHMHPRGAFRTWTPNVLAVSHLSSHDIVAPSDRGWRDRGILANLQRKKGSG